MDRFMDEIVDRLKDHCSSSSCSANIVYLFYNRPSDYSYSWMSLKPRYPYMKFDDLCGIVICDYSIFTYDIFDYYKLPSW